MAANPITGTFISAVAPTDDSSRVSYQILNGVIQQKKITGNLPSVNENISDPTAAPRPTPVASVTWNSGQEIRVFYLDPNFVIHDLYITNGRWTPGRISEMEVRAAPSAGLSAAMTIYQNNPHIRVFYQDADARTVKELIDSSGNHLWTHGSLGLLNTAPNSNLASTMDMSDGQIRVHLFYQDGDLVLKGYIFRRNEWSSDPNFNKAAMARSPISVIGVDTAPPRVQVYWRTPTGRVNFATKRGEAWDPDERTIATIVPGYQFSVVQWSHGGKLRLYYQRFDGHLVVYASDNSGNTWEERQIQ